MEEDQRFSAPEYARIKSEKVKTVRAIRARRPQTVRDRLTAAFGVFGFALYYLLFTAIAYAPLLILDFSWWIDLLLIAGILFLPFVGRLTELVLWVWAFLLVVEMEPCLKAALFYIGAALYVLFVLLPSILHLFIDY